ncbi:MAG: low affinity iron permease family protein [Xanthobacteraceae bacterium]|nr:low affinity iron permease family protein [Xanthobacteraceae bacterium]QYK46657.1 MAG: low affinity iron permease family protein [Xanthobacteraceae bacterium]HMN50542.1 low affinity iron permease family protein [Xanthobacteraceae bacterium]
MGRTRSKAAAKLSAVSFRPPDGFSDRLDTWFTEFAHNTSRFSGSPWVFTLAVLTVLVWAISGPLFGFSDTWQLVINTGTTIVTFLMVFLIQNTQNRDALAVQVKLSELIIKMHGARNDFAQIEDLTDKELEQLHEIIRQRAGCDPVRPRSMKKSRTRK